MNGAWPRVALAFSLFAAPGCRSAQPDLSAINGSPTAVERATRLAQALADTDTTGDRAAPLAQWRLPPALQEISGLALTSDGRMLVHDDELGQVWEVDYRRGVLVKRFSLGEGALKGDFEGIAIAKDVVFLVSGSGKLFEFHEGANHTSVDYVVHDPGLKKECAFEGVAYDPTINSLVLACKIVLNKAFRDALVFYRWRLDAPRGAQISRMTVPLAAVIGSRAWKHVQPSDITVDPVTGNYVLIASASDEKALISITPAGVVAFVRALPALHHQPEGITITRDGVLIVSDEAAAPPAIITLYRWDAGPRIDSVRASVSR